MEKRHKDRLRRLANAVEQQVEDEWFDLKFYHNGASEESNEDRKSVV